MSHGTAVQNIRQMFPLSGVQLGWPSTAMALQESFIAMLIPSSDPRMNPGAVHLQTLCDLTGGLSLNAEHDGLQSQGDARGLVGLCCLAKSFESSQRSCIALGEDGCPHRKAYVVLLTRRTNKRDSVLTGKQKCHLPST